MLELIVLVADKDTELTVRTLIEKRFQPLNVRALKFDKQQADIIRHERHDAGTFIEAHQLLRPYVGKAERALVMLDREGSGQEQKLSAHEMESEIENRLVQHGWSNEQVTAIVLDPELEIWVWSKSSHVARVLNVNDDQLQQVFAKYPQDANGKPNRNYSGVVFPLILAN